MVRRLLNAIGSRALVYIAGFVTVIFLKKYIDPSLFGIYSFFQSITELGAIICCLGLSTLAPRLIAKDQQKISRSLISTSFLSGLFIAIAFVALLTKLIHAPIDLLTYALIVLNSLTIGGSVFLLTVNRSTGDATLFNIESGIRNVVVLLLVAAFLAVLEKPSIGVLLSFNLAANLFVLFLAAQQLNHGSISKSTSRCFSLPSRDQLLLFGTSILSFALKKSDLIIFFSVMGAVYAGTFKVAFLLAEAPFQFTQAFYYTHTQTIAGHGTSQSTLKRVLLPGLVLGTALLFGALVFINLFGSTLNFGDVSLSIFLCLAPFFFIKLYSSYWDQLMLLSGRSSRQLLRTISEAIVKAACIGTAIALYPTKPHIAFLALAVMEVVIVEYWIRIEFEFSALGSLYKALLAKKS